MLHDIHGELGLPVIVISKVKNETMSDSINYNCQSSNKVLCVITIEIIIMTKFHGR